MKYYLFFAIVFLPLLFACSKTGNTLVFEGNVVLKNTNRSATGITLLLKGKVVDNNSYGRIMTLAEQAAEDDGKYRIEIDNVRASEFTLTVSKAHFFSVTQKISGTAVEPGKPYYQNFNLYPKAYVSVHLRNYYEPRKPEDVITITVQHNSPECDACCQEAQTQLKGADVDTVLLCPVYGNQTVQLRWEVNKNGEITNHSHDLNCGENDTTSYSIDY